MTFGEIVAEAEQGRHAGGTSAGKPRSYTGQYLKEILARSERVETGSAIKLAKARARVSKREREAAE